MTFPVFASMVVVSAAIVPLLVAVPLIRRSVPPGRRVALAVLGSGLVLTTWLGLPWSWLGMHLRTGLLAAWFLALVVGGWQGFRGRPSGSVGDGDEVRGRPRTRAASVALTIAGLALLVLAMPSVVSPEDDLPAVDLAPPLHGPFVVAQGGGTRLLDINEWERPARGYVVLYSLGPGLRRGTGPFPGDPSGHHSWEAPILAPCEGVVRSAVAGREDMGPGEVKQRRRTWGNYVVVQCDAGFNVLLAHPRRGSLEVVSGQRVDAGDRLGLLGHCQGRTGPGLLLGVAESESFTDRDIFRSPHLRSITIDGRAAIRHRIFR
jgi:hypothetical protein